MQDVISMMRRDNIFSDPLKQDGLFEQIQAGNYIIDAQASKYNYYKAGKYHYYKPLISGMPAYMYDSFEVQILPEIPTMVEYHFKNHNMEKESNIIVEVTKRELQWLYDYLVEYTKQERSEKWTKLVDKLGSFEISHEEETMQYAINSHTNDGLVKKYSMRKMFLMTLGMKR